MNFKYEITATGALEVYADTQEQPILFQATWPDGTRWGTGEAESWAELYIQSITDEKSLLPGPSPQKPAQPRPTQEEIDAYNRSQPLQITAGQLEEIIASKVAELLAK
jgi:hypothetical protein